jgi:hypothetical protein
MSSNKLKCNLGAYCANSIYEKMLIAATIDGSHIFDVLLCPH